LEGDFQVWDQRSRRNGHHTPHHGAYQHYRHPDLDLLDFGSTPDFFVPGLEQLRSQLTDQPCMFAFIAEEQHDRAS